jgi:hypothetical protein
LIFSVDPFGDSTTTWKTSRDANVGIFNRFMAHDSPLTRLRIAVYASAQR